MNFATIFMLKLNPAIVKAVCKSTFHYLFWHQLKLADQSFCGLLNSSGNQYRICTRCYHLKSEDHIATYITTPHDVNELMDIGKCKITYISVHTLTPSAIRPCARTTDVVVPSPAKSLVFAAACLTNLAPMFSTGSSNSTLRRNRSIKPSRIQQICFEKSYRNLFFIQWKRLKIF